MRIKRGDQVEVIAGNDKGKQGKVLKVFPKKNRVIVEGINFIKRHTRPSQNNPQGGIVEKEAPIDVSNVQLLHNGEPTRIGYDYLEDGTKVRVAKSTGEVIDS
ncbi:MAG: 50S ribosomal protein L24 [Candidatus Marinimicrobia bacterium]|nr:50S ribosomal protein L24 [Candidatus Neomarinimicrobiota bacterium]MCF7827483.1 50S ribosomal protein L24 [Candidatus Neomarinimicrobiota bacterium]MCF7882387.1 50S ribosomal protein L24 [Candidatus Neomarinimicrobiota bacterium]